MNSNDRLQRLKQLKIERHEGRPLFKSSDDCMIWIDNVAPLLKYAHNHYNDFLRHAQFVRITTLSADAIMPHLNSMMGIVNQAIIELENKIPAAQSSPNKIILSLGDVKVKDLIFASNYRIRLLLLAILLAGFGVGLTLGSSKLYKEKIIPLIELYKTQDTLKKNQSVPIGPVEKNTENRK